MGVIRRWVTAVAAAVMLALLLVGVPLLLVALGWVAAADVDPGLGPRLDDAAPGRRTGRHGDQGHRRGGVGGLAATGVGGAVGARGQRAQRRAGPSAPATTAGRRRRLGRRRTPVRGDPRRRCVVRTDTDRLGFAADAIGARNPLTSRRPTPASPRHHRQPRWRRPPRVDPRWVVDHGDTMWSIAETTLGDGTRVGDIVALNPTISPRHLRDGHVLTLPADARVPADRVPAMLLRRRRRTATATMGRRR